MFSGEEEALFRTLLNRLISGVAKRIGCPERLVTIEYENGYTSPGEASWLWTIRAEYQGPDRRVATWASRR